MGYSTWHTYGYGICTDEIETTVEKIEELLSKAPKLRSEVHDYFKDRDVTKPTVRDYEDYDEDWHCGLATILCSVIKEVDDVQFVAVDDFDGNRFLLFPECYPWQLNEKEKNLTEEGIEEIIRKYVSILTDKPIEIGYRSVENGG